MAASFLFNNSFSALSSIVSWLSEGVCGVPHGTGGGGGSTWNTPSSPRQTWSCLTDTSIGVGPGDVMFAGVLSSVKCSLMFSKVIWNKENFFGWSFATN